MTTTDIIGFIGVTILLLAFFLQLIDKISKEHYPYIVMNLFGAGLSCFASVLLNYWPFIILEGTWSLVSLWAFLKLSFSKNS
ncbi:MAG: hypothetical protein ABI723_16960 [Bacteroidia bacterium]